MEEKPTNRPIPVPRPRRQLSTNSPPIDTETETKTAYENVSIDLINKNIIIKNENYNEINKNLNKLKNQNKKSFQLTTEEQQQQQQQQQQQYQQQPNLNNNSIINNNQDKNVLTNLNNLTQDKIKIKNISAASSSATTTITDAVVIPLLTKTNNKVDDKNKLKPIPAPRRQTQQQQQLQLNDNIYPNPNDTTTPTIKTTDIYSNVQKNSGAISKKINVTRKAPEIPDKINNINKNNNIVNDVKILNSNQQLSSNNNNINNNNNNNNSNNNSNSNIDRNRDTEDESSINLSLEVNLSDSTISSLDKSIDLDTTTTNEQILKYNTTSPGELLKSLGTTSKLLSESITERVAVRTKGARHKLDKIHKSSIEFISTWGSERSKNAATKLKNVRSKIGSNSSNGGGGGGGGIGDDGDNDGKRMPEFNADRPQTLPPDDVVFSSISFNSPITKNTANNSNAITAMNNNNIFIYPSLSDFESSYEVPKSSSKFKSPSSSPSPSSSSSMTSNNKSTNLYLYPCPTYEESMNSSITSLQSLPPISLASSPSPSQCMPTLPPPSFQRNTNLTQSMFSTIGTRSSPILKLAPPTTSIPTAPSTPTIAHPTTPNLIINNTKNTIDSSIYENTIINKKPFSFNNNIYNNRPDSPSSSSGEDLPCPNFPAPILNYNNNNSNNNNNKEDEDEDENGYGKIRKSNQIKRRPPDDYEMTKIRMKPSSASASSSVSVSSLTSAERLPKIFSRDVSNDIQQIRQKKNVDDIKLKIPDFNTAKSESWSYYDVSNTDNNNNNVIHEQDAADNDVIGYSSSPEPIYANENCEKIINIKSNTNVLSTPVFRQEPVYGLLYEKDINDGILLQPQTIPRKKRSKNQELIDEPEPSTSFANNLNNSIIDNGNSVQLSSTSSIATSSATVTDTIHDNIPTDILIEFDPLITTAVNQIISNKSNELILLENLLGEATYGTITDDSNYDDNQSIDLSDDEQLLDARTTSLQRHEDSIPLIESTNVIASTDSITTATTTTTTTTTTTALQISRKSKNKNSQKPALPPPLTTERKAVIIHQNLRLRSDSMENILDDEDRIIHPYLATDSESLNSLDNQQIEQIDLSHPMPSRTNWFVRDSIEQNEQITNTNLNLNRIENKLTDKKDIIKIDPPSYNEAIGNIDTSVASSSISATNQKEINSQKEQEQEQKEDDKRSPKSSMKLMFSNVMNRMEGINLGLKRKTSFKNSSQQQSTIKNNSNNNSTNGNSNNNQNDVKTLLEMIPKPKLTNRLVLHEGHLIRLPSGVVEDIFKELHARKAYIRERRFQAFCDKDFKVPKENIPMEYITTIQCVSTHKFSNNSVDIHCFEITTALPKHHYYGGNQNNMIQHTSNPNIIMTSNNSGNCKTQRVCHLYGVAKESERYIWMQKLLDCMTDVFPSNFTSKYYRAGCCYLKNLITAEWSGAWILLQKQKRKLLFYSNNDMNLECMDLRKARCLVLKECDDSIKNLHVETGPMLMIDCPPYSMYFIMTSPRETKIWRHIIKEVAHNNGPSLKDQQLTKDDVPVLVDKCINFIYAHGSLSEGIFRKSGSENSINKLLNLFRMDAFGVQITRTEYNEHDAANTLKRFMRDLPDRLIGRYSASFISVSEMKSKTEKLRAYKELLQRLPTIEYHTLKKLIGHLNFIQSQRNRNKMGVDNLAMIWGPTLLQDKRAETMQYSQKEANCIADLIVLYKNLYQLSVEEISKEQIMLNVLQKYHAAAENLSDTVKKSGDLKVWITIDPCPDSIDNDDKQQINVTLTPTKTVYDVCKELSMKLKKEPHDVTLSEIILNGQLQRPLHYKEKVFDIVLKWSYWPESDRKNNYLQLAPIRYLKEVQRALKMLPIVSPNKELKFADRKTKSLKSYTLELNDNKIIVMKKEKSAIVTVLEIDLTKSIAYIGCEKKRDFQLRWAITLIESDTNKCILRTRESPFIGHVIAGTNSNDQIVWYSSILNSLYSTDIVPSSEIIIP